MRMTLTVNGTQVDADVPTRLPLAELLRDELGLTGTKVGCDTGSCGSCVVEVDGRAVKSCTVLAVQAAHATVTTIEGIARNAADNAAEDGGLDRLQAALRTEHGVQCGFCTPGMVMALRELLDRNPAPSEAETRAWLAGNLCRCTGYAGILRAVRSLVPELVGQEHRR